MALRQIYKVFATQIVVSESNPQGVHSDISGYPKSFDSRNYKATAENPNGDPDIALLAAQAEFKNESQKNISKSSDISEKPIKSEKTKENISKQSKIKKNQKKSNKAKKQKSIKEDNVNKLKDEVFSSLNKMKIFNEKTLNEMVASKEEYANILDTTKKDFFKHFEDNQDVINFKYYFSKKIIFIL